MPTQLNCSTNNLLGSFYLI